MSSAAAPASPAPRPRGLSCPLCKGVRFISTSRRRPAPNLKVVYLRCAGCKARLVKHEKIVSVSRTGDSVPDPGTVS